MKIEGFSCLVLLHQSNNAQVYSAYQDSLQRRVILKISDKNLKQEATKLAELNHPYLIKVFDYFQFQNKHILVQEKFDGLSIDQLKDQETHVILSLFMKIAEGLHYLHNNGRVHGDIQPQNILVDKNYRIKIIDLEFSVPIGSYSLGITKGFQNPESLAQKPLDPQSDIYSLGLCLYHTLSKKSLLDIDQSTNFNAKILEFLDTDFAPIEIRQMVKSCLRVAETYDDAEVFAEQIEMFLTKNHFSAIEFSEAIDHHYKLNYMAQVKEAFEKSVKSNDITETTFLLKHLEELGADVSDEWKKVTKPFYSKPTKKIFIAMIVLVICVLFGSILFINTNSQPDDFKEQMQSDLVKMKKDTEFAQKELLNTKDSNQSIHNKAWVVLPKEFQAKMIQIDERVINDFKEGLFLSFGAHTLEGLNSNGEKVFYKKFEVLKNGQLRFDD